MEQTLGLKSGMKIFSWIMGVICIPLIVTIPFAILMLMLAIRGGITLRADKFTTTWIRKRELAWADIAKIWWGPQPKGIAGAMMGRPLMLQLKNGKKPAGIMIESYENTPEILQAFKTQAGLEPTAAP